MKAVTTDKATADLIVAAAEKAEVDSKEAADKALIDAKVAADQAVANAKAAVKAAEEAKISIAAANLALAYANAAAARFKSEEEVNAIEDKLVL